MVTGRRGCQLLIACCLIVGTWQTAWAGGKSCRHCGSHKELKADYRLVKICQEVDMPEYACTKQESFYPDKGSVCHQGYRCDTYHSLWINCDCTLSCQSHTVCGCQTLYGAKSTGHHAGCPVRQPYAVSKLTVPILKWEIVHYCRDCGDKSGRSRKK